MHLHDLAASLGCSLADVQWHYDQKDALAEAWFDRADQALLAAAKAPGWRALPQDQRLQRALWAWREHPAALNAHAWNDARLQAFRRFAALPAVSSAAGDTARHCRWFSDLRYDLPALPDTFRDGVCRDTDGSWAAYRMPYLREEGPQRLR